MNEIPRETDIHFCVFDNSNPKEPDYFFLPFIYMETFNAAALVIKIGDHTIRMPHDWQVLIGEKEVGDLEVVPLTSLNDRGFSAFTFNPIDGFRPDFKPIEIMDIYPDVKFYFPKLKPGNMLAIPLTSKEESKNGRIECAFFVKDITRQSEIVNYTKAW